MGNCAFKSACGLSESYQRCQHNIPSVKPQESSTDKVMPGVFPLPTLAGAACSAGSRSGP